MNTDYPAELESQIAIQMKNSTRNEVVQAGRQRRIGGGGMDFEGGEREVRRE